MVKKSIKLALASFVMMSIGTVTISKPVNAETTTPINYMVEGPDTGGTPPGTVCTAKWIKPTVCWHWGSK